MTSATLGVLVASLLGSTHCAAMCGGFVCFYAGSATPARDAAILRAHALYNAGRLASYLLLGAVAGAVGAGVTGLGALTGVANAAAIVAGVLMVGWAAGTVAAHLGISLRLPPAPALWNRTVSRALGRFRDQPLGARAALIGLATTLLPCGWLYVFVAAAGGTGSVGDAMLVMATFWLGSVPALAAVGLGAQRLFGPLRARLPLVGAVSVLIIGVLALTGRIALAVTAGPHGH